jgi:hypothetical protein
MNGATRRQATTHEPSTILERYTGTSFDREKLHFVSTLRLSKVENPLRADKALYYLIHYYRTIRANPQYSFYWAQINNPSPGDCYIVQRKIVGSGDSNISHPFDSCHWTGVPQVFQTIFKDWVAFFHMS